MALRPRGRSALRGRKRGRGKSLTPKTFFKKVADEWQPIVVNGALLNREEAQVWAALQGRPSYEGWECQAQLGPVGKAGSRRPDFLSRTRGIVLEHTTSFHESEEAKAKDALKKMMYHNMGFEVKYTYTADLPNIKAVIQRLLG